jgi:hypothetical protein
MSIQPSDTACGVLAAAAMHPDGLAVPPAKLPRAAANAVARILLKQGWVERTEAMGSSVWHPEPGAATGLRVTAAGLDAIGRQAMPVALAQDRAAAAASDPTHRRPPLRDAVRAVLAAWDNGREGHPDLAAAIDGLRLATAPRRPRRQGTGAEGVPRPPRADTKQAAVVALLRRPQGASGPQIIEATGWAPHTVRGFLAGLTRKGTPVTVLERVRQIGPKREGGKGSYTIYQIAD